MRSRLFKSLYFLNSTNMKIENTTQNGSLAFNPHQYPLIQEQIVDPYQFLLLQGEDRMSAASRALEANEFDCFQDILSIELCEQEEMLLDFLLPERKNKQLRCIKEISYNQFITNSIKEYEQQMKRYRQLEGMIIQ